VSKKEKLREKLRIIKSGNTAITPAGEIVNRGTPGARDYESRSLSTLTPLEMACAAISALLAKAGFSYSEDEGRYSREGYSLEFKPVTSNSKVACCANGRVDKLSSHVDDPTVMVIGSRGSHCRNMKVAYASYAEDAPVQDIFVSISICMDMLMRSLGDPFPALNPPEGFLKELKLTL